MDDPPPADQNTPQSSSPGNDPDRTRAILLFVLGVLAIIIGAVLAGINPDDLTEIAAATVAVIAAAIAASRATS